MSGTNLVNPPAAGGGGDVATDVIWDTKGDLAAATGADAAVKVGVGANGTALVADSAQSAGVGWVVPVGTIVDYVEFATDITVSATTAAAANTIVTGAGWTPNGTDSFWLEFSCAVANPASTTGAGILFVVYDNGSLMSPERIAQVTTPAGSTLLVTVFNRIKVTPSNASHTYSIRAYRVTGNGTVFGTAGGVIMPGHIAITKAA